MAKGFTALIVVMIITMAGLAMITTAVWLGVGGMEMAQAWQGANGALDVAEGCVENALERLSFDSNYNGETLSQGDKSCIITVIKVGSPMTTANLQIDGAKGNYHQKIFVSLEVNDGKFNIISWQENNF